MTSTLRDDQLISGYLDRCWAEKGLSGNTLSSYRHDLCSLLAWTQSQELGLVQLTADDIRRLLAVRYAAQLSARSTSRFLSCLRGFFGYLMQEGLIVASPLQDVESPRIGRGLPKTLSEADVDRLLAAPDLESAIGLRDRTMLELLYACGLRVSELVGLTLDQVNLRQGVVRVMGKGGKERLVPIGDEAQAWVIRFVRDVRPTLLEGATTDIVFPSSRAQRMTRQTFWHRIKHWALVAGIDKPLSPHTLRHAFATHLLNHGADIRSVQMLLGHSDLSTTQIYTYVAQQRLKMLHAEHHPRG